MYISVFVIELQAYLKPRVNQCSTMYPLRNNPEETLQPSKLFYYPIQKLTSII